MTSRRTYAAVLLISFGALLNEVALTRLFSFSIWYHFAYMTISVALLGYAAAGSACYAFAPALARVSLERSLMCWAVLAALLFIVCLLVVSAVPFDPSALFPHGIFDWWAPRRQFLYLLVFHLAVTAPFFSAGMCITLVLSNAVGRIPQIYFADLAGGALGCLAAVVLLTPLGAPGVVVLGAACLAGAGALFAWPDPRRRSLAGLLAALLAVAGLPLSRAIDVAPSPTKFLAQLLSRGNAGVIYKRWHPAYRVDLVGGVKAPLRMGRQAAWGVSDVFTGEMPETLVINYDGDASTMVYRFGGDFASLAMLDHSLLRLPYLFLDRPEVLVIGAGGGVDLLTALKNGCRHVTGVELNSVTVDLLQHGLADYTGNVFNRADVRLVVDEGRNFVRRGDRAYDLIEITGVDTLSAVYSGAYVLSESYLYTVEAFREYLAHLTPSGVLSIVRGDLDEAPFQVLRTVSIAVEALRGTGIEEPSRHVAVTRYRGKSADMAMFSILVRRAPFRDDEVERLLAHSRIEDFEPWHIPGRQLDTPAGRLVTMTPAERERFLADNPADLRPPLDDRPFFFNFLKWDRIAETRRRSGAFLGSGQFVLLTILLQSMLFALVLIVGPLGWRRAPRLGAAHLRYCCYFAALGLGFMFIEISYIQRFTLFLGSPVFSLSVILATLLLSSGTGSFLSGRLRLLADGPRALRRLFAALAVLNALYVAFLPSVLQACLGTPLAARVVVTAALLAPAGLIMGGFLPVGMRLVSASAPEMIPWAWAANGVASVIGSVLCIVLAMSIGFRAVNILAVGIYLAGVLAMGGPAASPSSSASGPRA